MNYLRLLQVILNVNVGMNIDGYTMIIQESNQKFLFRKICCSFYYYLLCTHYKFTVTELIKLQKNRVNEKYYVSKYLV